jgi:hypothetical protein
VALREGRLMNCEHDPTELVAVSWGDEMMFSGDDVHAQAQS